MDRLIPVGTDHRGHPKDSPLRGKMIFNVGSRRSGTFWLQRIVTAHPLVGEVPSETHLLSHGIAPLLERFHQGERMSTEVGSVYAPRPAVVAAARHLCDTIFAEFIEPGQLFVAERTPLHVFHLPLISEIYPDAKFVHIIRDGRDVARSIAAQDWGPDTIADAAAEWRDAVRSGLDAGLDSTRYMEVRYERMLADREREIERLYGWLELPTSAEDLAYPLRESERLENVDRFGIRGVATQKWSKVFTPRDLAAFESVAGELLDQLGYPRAEATVKPSVTRSALRRFIRRRRVPGA